MSSQILKTLLSFSSSCHGPRTPKISLKNVSSISSYLDLLHEINCQARLTCRCVYNRKIVIFHLVNRGPAFFQVIQWYLEEL